MKKTILLFIWGWLYLICAALGHATEVTATQQTAMTVLSVIFFIPGFWLLADGWKKKRKDTCSLVFYISLGSLILTLVMLLLNVMSVTGSEALGNVMYALLIWLSAPMICSGYWILSLFLWGVLLFSAIFCKKRL